MEFRTIAFSVLLISPFVVRSAGAVSHWPQYRGIQASGVNDRQEAPTTWSIDSGTNLRWQTPIPGLGHSSPILWENRVYVTTAVKPGQAELKVGLYGDIESVTEKVSHEWHVLALDRDSGKVVWDTISISGIPRTKRHPKASPCNSTPATDGQHVVAILGSEGLFCFDLDGKLSWKKDLGPMNSGYYEVPSAQWGFASSPVIHNGKVVVLCDVQKDSFLAVFDITDGRELWRTPRSDVPTWGTPAIVESGGTTQIVVNGWHQSGGYDFTSGKQLWHLDGGGDIPVPTPIFSHGFIYLTSGHGKERPMRAIRPDALGNISPSSVAATNSGIAWVAPRLGTYMQTPIVVQDWVYGCLDNGVTTCFDAATGRVQFSERLSTVGEGFTSSPVSDGRHLFFASETGNVYVVPAAKTFSVTSTNQLGETCMATPALVDGTLYYRTRSRLVAIGKK